MSCDKDSDSAKINLMNKTESQIQNIIFKHLPAKDYQVFVFGSRATGRAKKWSDYDIGIQGKKPLALQILSKIDEDLEESDIPYLVDVVDFSQVRDKFKQFALKNIKLWKTN
ncbi:MAG: Toxin-antitoxin system, toxin component family protein [Berkelbacteria bacterium GW2011_GWA2_38_9]|uniref:Toxin-antitoxin system, toxin component family protein n=1 Tax=Berkelbacteria bacterium GW2011_GWA2_38_9 TaxID=1618334 RepID=A0A0G0LNT3_9BACT|nr:MAG: Toxin-antitoxin system, toxin component family protein [Berkelbacteria bacterium GW2011_GWA2_38_9]